MLITPNLSYFDVDRFFYALAMIIISVYILFIYVSDSRRFRET